MQSHLTVCGFSRVPCLLAKNSFTENFLKRIHLEIRQCKKCYCLLSKSSLHYYTVIDQRWPVFHQLFSWTWVGASKCSIHKMIDWQSEQLPNYHVYLVRNLSQKIFCKCIVFEIRHFRKVHYPFCKFSLHSLTASWSEVSSLSPIVQLDFSWTLGMSNQQSDRLPRLSLWSS